MTVFFLTACSGIGWLPLKYFFQSYFLVLRFRSDESLYQTTMIIHKCIWPLSNYIKIYHLLAGYAGLNLYTSAGWVTQLCLASSWSHKAHSDPLPWTLNTMAASWNLALNSLQCNKSKHMATEEKTINLSLISPDMEWLFGTDWKEVNQENSKKRNITKTST